MSWRGASSSKILWHTLKAHEFMAEVKELGFENHPLVAPVLILHVFGQRVPINKHNKLEEKVAKIDKALNKLQSLFDKAVSGFATIDQEIWQ